MRLDVATYAEVQSWLRRGPEARERAPMTLLTSDHARAGSQAATVGDIESISTFVDQTRDERPERVHAAYPKGKALVAFGFFAEAEPRVVETVARSLSMASDVHVALTTSRSATVADGRGERGRTGRYPDVMTSQRRTDAPGSLRSDQPCLLALVACEPGELRAVAAVLAEAIAAQEASDDPYSEEVLASTAVFASRPAEYEVAPWLRGDAGQDGETLGTLCPYPDGTAEEHAEAPARAPLGGHATPEGWDRGHRLLMVEVIDVVRAFLAGATARCGETRTTGTTSQGSGAHGLTRRELEVLREVAAGKSNREIAEELCISVPTVKRHLTNVLGKLALSSRSALNTFAHAHGLGPGEVGRAVRPVLRET